MAVGSGAGVAVGSGSGVAVGSGAGVAVGSGVAVGICRSKNRKNRASSGDKYLVSCWIIASVAFLCGGIANENTLECTGVQFVTMVGMHMDKGSTTKHLEWKILAQACIWEKLV